MSVALASRVEDAVLLLGEAERSALERRVRGSEDYARIGGRLGVGREGVADLLVAARLGVWASLKDEPAPVRRTPSCGPARRVLAAQSDGEAVGASDADRAREHLADCEPCRHARLALREAELACRTWSSTDERLPPPPNVSPGRPHRGIEATQLPRRALVYGRRRLIAAAVAVVVLLVAVALLFGGGDPAPRPAAPQTGPGSAQGSGHDVVPGPGDTFCPDGERTCK